MTVISIHSILTGPAIKTRVTVTVIDDGIARFAWVHRTTEIKMDGVADNTGKPGGERSSLSPTGQVMQAFHHLTAEKCTARKHLTFLSLTVVQTTVNYIIGKCIFTCISAVSVILEKCLEIRGAVLEFTGSFVKR